VNLIDEVESQEGALTIEWLAKKLNISRKTLYRMASRGKLPCIRIGSCVRLNPKSIANWLRKRMTT
jgi:excisionase family DNA binding protein